MTVIAWDGKTLAADKRACNGTLRSVTTKIRRVGKDLVGYTGDASEGEELLAWFRFGADPEKFPAHLRSDSQHWARLVVVTPKREVLVFERGPHPVVFEDRFFAAGSGRDFALAAMHLGKSATEAVEVASVFDTSCGDGMDALTHYVEDTDYLAPPIILSPKSAPKNLTGEAIFRRMGTAPLRCEHFNTVAIKPELSARDPLGQATVKCLSCGAIGHHGMLTSEWL